MASSPESRHAVVYAAKSTEDKRGSIPTQLDDGRALCEREGWQIVGEFSDEGFSAYKGNRGPDLEHAKALAVDTAAEHGSCVLVSQHSDRLARGAGDAPGAADHLGELYFWLKRHGVTVHTAQEGELDSLRAVVSGERNTEDSRRKSESVKAGLARRKDRGEPVGPLALGYAVRRTVAGGEVASSRDVDAAEAAVVEAIFSRVESGESFGAVARRLNGDGDRTKRGGTWVSRTVREVVHNPAYKGEKGYPAIIEPGRFDRIHDALRRLDPVAVARRSGGRKPADGSYFLRGIVRCSKCGATLYTRRQAAGRMYVCANRRQGTGLCEAPPIPAELIEGHVLRHLDSFVGSVEGWLTEQVEARTADHQDRLAAVERERARLPELQRQREKLMGRYVQMEDEGDRLARLALEAVESCDAATAEVTASIAEAEAVVSEWTGPPDMDAALDFYSELVDFVTGQVREARGTAELNRALSQVLTGLWAEVEPERDRLLVEFELHGHDWRSDTTAAGTPVAPMLAHRPTLPPASMSYEPFEPLRTSNPDASPSCTSNR
jgi:DNA invertase Pin-like site-specific DNA recombinase